MHTKSYSPYLIAVIGLFAGLCGVSTAAQAAYTEGVVGQCGTAAGVETATEPANNLCADGTATRIRKEIRNGIWVWRCVGTRRAASASCTAPLQALDGVCGIANGIATPNKPTSNLCTTGNA